MLLKKDACYDDVPSTQAEKWIGAMAEEIKSLRKSKTWELVKPSAGRKIVGCK